MNHAHHLMREVRTHIVVQRDLGVLEVLNQSGLHTTIEPITSLYILQNQWYYQLWVTVCDYFYSSEMFWCKVLWAASEQVVIPILLVVGISNNALVIAGFWQRSVRRNVNRRLCLFYRLIASFDIWLLVMKDFVYYWLEYGLTFTTGGHLSLLTRTRSSFWYTLIKFWTKIAMIWVTTSSSLN